MTQGWQHHRAGFYCREQGKAGAIVRQDGELWRTYVYFDGLEVDRAEWDSRGAALRNAWGAMKRAHDLRSISAITKDPKLEEDEE